MATISEKTAILIEKLNAKFAEISKAQANDHYTPKYEIIGYGGRKYDRLMMNDNMAYAFVDRKTGDIYMPAGLKAPAKHVRYWGDEHDLAVEDADTSGGFLYLNRRQ